jgi:hypothetical protein
MRHWATVKAVTEDILRDRTVWFAIERNEANELRSALAACDSTKNDLYLIHGKDTKIIATRELQYLSAAKALRRTKKITLIAVLASFAAGFWIGSK